MYPFRLIIASRVLLALCLFHGLFVWAQSATLHGQVQDESGAVIPGANVTAIGPAGHALSATSGADGSYSLRSVPAGQYTVKAAFPGFAMAAPVSFTERGQDAILNLILKVSAVVQSVTVQADESATVSVESANNASATVLSGNKLDALADDPDDMATDLQALAGPSAGPNGGSIYIDGFSTGELPSKDSIREIRINQNPFSPEFDSLGLGRIEVLTKPGSGKFHGNTSDNMGRSMWNSRNPYAAVKAPFLLREYGLQLTGPLNKHASFTVDSRGEFTRNGAVINGATLDPTTLAIISPFTSVAAVPQGHLYSAPQIDYQLGEKHTLSLHYRITQNDVQDSGIGGFNLIESADHAHSLAQTTQFIDTYVINAKTVNETRFQFFNVSQSTVATNTGPSIQVMQAFVGGGSPVGQSSDTLRNIELQNITTLTHGRSVWHFGMRLRTALDQNVSQQNFNGVFTFAGDTAPELNANNQVVDDSNGNPILAPLSSIQQYQRTLMLQKAGFSNSQVVALGGGASQFSLSAGNPLVSLSQTDIAVFVGDSLKVRPNLTLDVGLRYESQNSISDHADFAPRIAAALSPAAFHQKLVLRAGFGIFYNRYALGNTLGADRYNGVNQQQFVVDNPGFFPAVPTAASVSASQSPQVIQQTAPNLHAPYLMQSLFSVEQQLPFHTVMALSYSNSHGLDQLRSQDINVPPASGGPYPLGNSNPVFQVESNGLFNQNQFIANVTSAVSKSISLFGSYTFGRAMSNTDGVSTFPGNPYSMAGEYGPAATDVRNFETLGGAIQWKWRTMFSPLLTFKSGAPFNITAGRDLYGTTLFTGRPGIATNPTRSGLIQTRYGLLDPSPIAGEAILPRNDGRGPGNIQINLRSSKTIGFGPERAAGDLTSRRYALVFSVSMRNLINHNNPGPIIGNISSPIFGRANQPAGSATQPGAVISESANNRRFEFVMRFSF